MLRPPVSHAAISDIERGMTKCDLGYLAELARVLDKPSGYFTTGLDLEGARRRRGAAPEVAVDVIEEGCYV